MKIKTLLGATALATLPLTGGVAFAQELPACESCADSMVLMSWGGAYQASQVAAYAEPYAALTGVTITWDEGSNEAVAKMRAASEAGNMTYDLVDVEGPDSQRACDEGLALEVDFDAVLAAGDDGSTPTDDFGTSGSIINECFVPQIVFSTTFGYRTDVAAWNGATPDSLCAVFDLAAFPGMRALEGRPKKNLEWALLCDGVAKDDIYDVLSSEGGVDRALAKLDTIRDSVVWWSAGA